MELRKGLAKRARVQPALDRDLKHRGSTFELQWSSKKMTKAGKSTSTSRTRKSVADVDAYIAAAPAAVQPQLRKLRAMIRAEAPQAIEKISYGIPFCEYGDKPNSFQSRLIYFAAQKNHIAVYPAGETQGLEQYLTERSTLRFPMDKPLPMAKIRALVRTRVWERDPGAKANPVNSRRPTSRSRFATADPPGRVRASHPGAVRAANGTRACRRSHPPVPGPPHARP